MKARQKAHPYAERAYAVTSHPATPFQRYVTLLNDAFGEGDPFRGFGRKPHRVRTIRNICDFCELTLFCDNQVRTEVEKLLPSDSDDPSSASHDAPEPLSPQNEDPREADSHLQRATRAQSLDQNLLPDVGTVGGEAVELANVAKSATAEEPFLMLRIEDMPQQNSADLGGTWQSNTDAQKAIEAFRRLVIGKITVSRDVSSYGLSHLWV